jgi:hypothetical protein
MKNKIFITLTFLASVLVLNSCLKDNLGEDWTSSLKGKMYAEVWKGGFAALALQPIPDTVEFKFLVNIATDALPTQDITLTLDTSIVAMNRYDTLKHVNYKLYPYIKILNKVITIKAGTRNAYCHVLVWHADTLNPCDNFMAPIVIKTATGGVVVTDALNQGSRLMALPISNPYAGTYNTVGYRIRPGNATEYIGAGTQEVFSTVNCSTVDKNGFGNYGTFNVSVQVTTETMVLTNGHTVYKVICTVYNPADGSVQGGNFLVWNGDLAALPAPPATPTEINYWDPVTKQFVLNCFYLSGAGNRIMWEVHTKI